MTTDDDSAQRINVLDTLYNEWAPWARTAPHPRYKFQSWQAAFPKWVALLSAARDVMLLRASDANATRLIAACWAISQSDEPLATFARDHLDICRDVVLSVAQSRYPTARRQALEVLGEIGHDAEPFLRVGLADPDPYCRIQAIIALTRLQPDDALALALPLFHDPHWLVRYYAYQLATSRLPKHMRFFTRHWRDGNDETDSFAAYEQHLQSLSAAVPDALMALARVGVHDARVKEVRADVGTRVVILRLRCFGQPDEGQFDLVVRYDDAVAIETDVAPIAEIVLNRETEVLYQEVDRTDDEGYEHRLLLWPRGELVIRFTRLHLSQQAVDEGLEF